jgi:hypothetical protein
MPPWGLADQAGNGPVTVVFGVAVFLVFLLLSSQVIVHLYATSTVTAAAFDAARRVAAEEGGACGPGGSHAREQASRVLGRYAADAGGAIRVDCTVVDDLVQVTVAGPSPARAMARTLGGLTSLETIERTASVRLEGFDP